MKNILYSLTLAIVLSGCIANATYQVLKGKLDVPKKQSYQITYRAAFGDGLSANIIYTDENGGDVELKKINGIWEKQVVLKSGTRVQFQALAKAGAKSRAEYKILVDGKEVSGYILSGKRLNYVYKFELP
ncbi:hypothetical protein [Pedobacter miscanthi]|uniref:Uncharacterized protein n=1 Tax=Pedobacter miscanthi TaxID=2259170 RepID=A0A366KMQ2_9SPHI|nr:hypothetical protein [Pedobacter miscanthi]RBQ02553.1 hypothetical protein DRW42_25845 [Pedobacter miscanthi]